MVDKISSDAAARKLSPASRFAERFILTYRKKVSPGLGSRCRYVPSCSEYGLKSYRRYGFVRATAKTVWRLLRCSPLNPGGMKHDPP
ncbi:MAG: membrane protein insertion efficiency factor YidD [Dehalococcoidia bacterium]